MFQHQHVLLGRAIFPAKGRIVVHNLNVGFTLVKPAVREKHDSASGLGLPSIFLGLGDVVEVFVM